MKIDKSEMVMVNLSAEDINSIILEHIYSKFPELKSKDFSLEDIYLTNEKQKESCVVFRNEYPYDSAMNEVKH